MYDLEYSGQFKKDLKLMNKRGVNLNDLRKVLDYLIIKVKCLFRTSRISYLENIKVFGNVI